VDDGAVDALSKMLPPPGGVGFSQRHDAVGADFAGDQCVTILDDVSAQFSNLSWYFCLQAVAVRKQWADSIGN